MLQLNFYPESDDKKLKKGVNEYRNIWKVEGKKITDFIERYSELVFKTKIINAIVFDGESYSYPLRLSYDHSIEIKRNILIHELCHRLMRDNNLRTKKQLTIAKFTLATHKRIFLILYDILSGLYGEEYARRQVVWEVEKGDKSYKEAWGWALSFSPQERRTKFEEVLNNRT